MTTDTFFLGAAAVVTLATFAEAQTPRIDAVRDGQVRSVSAVFEGTLNQFCMGRIIFNQKNMDGIIHHRMYRPGISTI